MSVFIPLAIIAVIAVVGIGVLRKRLLSGGAGSAGGSRGRSGADKK